MTTILAALDSNAAARRVRCEEEPADLIVLSWSQDLSAGRADVVRWALGHSTVPVLLIPVDEAGIEPPSTAETGHGAR